MYPPSILICFDMKNLSRSSGIRGLLGEIYATISYTTNYCLPLWGELPSCQGLSFYVCLPVCVWFRIWRLLPLLFRLLEHYRSPCNPIFRSELLIWATITCQMIKNWIVGDSSNIESIEEGCITTRYEDMNSITESLYGLN